MKDAQQLNEKQKHYLQEAKDSFNKANKVSSQIKTAVQDIDDTKEKKKATAVVQLMEKRQNVFESYYHQYLDVLKLNNHLYEQLQSKALKASNLDKQIKKINQNYKTMKEQEQEFNHITKQYNQVKSQYYNKSSLTQKRINQMEEDRDKDVLA
ncbi:hypothetical protein GCM10028778_22820 [Barrientosiimonas marina]